MMTPVSHRTSCKNFQCLSSWFSHSKRSRAYSESFLWRFLTGHSCGPPYIFRTQLPRPGRLTLLVDLLNVKDSLTLIQARKCSREGLALRKIERLLPEEGDMYNKQAKLAGMLCSSCNKFVNEKSESSERFSLLIGD